MNEEEIPAVDIGVKKKHVLFVQDNVIESSNIKFISLKHPLTGSPQLCLLDVEKKKLFEISSFDEGHRSWFYGENVFSDGRIFLSTPLDPTFIILPYLMNSIYNVPLEDLLEDTAFPDMRNLLPLINDISHVAERKGNTSLSIWKYSDSSTLVWLERKVCKLALYLESKNETLSAAHSSAYSLELPAEERKVAYLHLAHGIISEYISDQLSEKLRHYLKIPEKIQKKRSHSCDSVNLETKSKKGKYDLECDDSIKHTSKIKNKIVVMKYTKAKALAKSAAGSRNIASFFSKR